MSSVANVTTTDFQTWHEHVGHVNKRTIREMAEKDIVRGVKFSNKNDFFCEPCQLGVNHIDFHLNRKKQLRLSNLENSFTQMWVDQCQ